jgi:hypothetical protein
MSESPLLEESDLSLPLLSTAEDDSSSKEDLSRHPCNKVSGKPATLNVLPMVVYEVVSRRSSRRRKARSNG